MSNILEFDGSFEGFLSLVAFTYEIRVLPERIITPNDTLSLFDEPFVIATNEALANRVYEAIGKKFHPKHCRLITLAWCYDTPPLFIELLTFIRLGFKDPLRLDDITQPAIKAIHDAATYVHKEQHKMVGFVRFVKLQDHTFYAKIHPKSNVLALLGDHFKERFTEPWIIHDTKRKTVLIHQQGIIQSHHVAHHEEPILHKEELTFQRLWKKFFKQIAITQRTNTALQRHFVPLRYRDEMTEFQ